MPIRYHLKPEKRLVILVHVGAVSDDEFLSFYRALYENDRLDQSFNLLIDLRQSESSLRSAVALNTIAKHMQKQFVGISARPKVAVIAPDDVSFGLARMYGGFTNDVSWEFVVFRAVDAALAWLGLSEDLMDSLEENAQQPGAPEGDPATPCGGSELAKRPPSVS